MKHVTSDPKVPFSGQFWARFSGSWQFVSRATDLWHLLASPAARCLGLASKQALMAAPGENAGVADTLTKVLELQELLGGMVRIQQEQIESLYWQIAEIRKQNAGGETRPPEAQA